MFPLSFHLSRLLTPPVFFLSPLTFLPSFLPSSPPSPLLSLASPSLSLCLSPPRQTALSQSVRSQSSSSSRSTTLSFLIYLRMDLNKRIKWSWIFTCGAGGQIYITFNGLYLSDSSVSFNLTWIKWPVWPLFQSHSLWIMWINPILTPSRTWFKPPKGECGCTGEHPSLQRHDTLIHGLYAYSLCTFSSNRNTF